MQLVRGPTLADAAPDLAVADIVKIMAQVAGAVHAAHRLKLIHRDLKPSNILLERSPEGGWTPYVCDFGLAMGLDDPTLTAPQWVHGTPAYMAPEQTRGDRARVGPGTDVYALGGALHFALHGQVPGGPAVARNPHRAAGGSRPARVVPRDLDLIIRKCRELDPERRYPTAAALAEELWRVHRGEPVETRPLGWLARPWHRWRGAWRPALAAVLAGAVLSGLAAAGLRFNRFHVTALCSPTRASFFTGRNHHAVGMGFLADVPMGFPGYTARIPKSAAALPRLLRDAGYSTLCVGKWHLTPRYERSAAGPFDRWPLGLGF